MAAIKQQGGFTLIEVIIAISVAAILMTSVIASSSTQRNEEKFSTAIDGIYGGFTNQQSEAQKSIQQPAGTRGKSDSVVFGKVMELTPGASTYKAYTLTIRSDKAGGMLACQQQTFTLPNEIVYKGTTNAAGTSGPSGGVQYVVFTRTPAQVFFEPAGATLTGPATTFSCAAPGVYTLPSGAVPPPPPTSAIVDNNVLNPANYDIDRIGINNFTDGHLLFQQNGSATRKGVIHISPTNNTLSRTFP